jgi:hypothetical protein
MKIKRTSIKIACNQASIRLALNQTFLGSPAKSATYVPDAEATKFSILSQVILCVWCAAKREEIIPEDSILLLSRLIRIK